MTMAKVENINVGLTLPIALHHNASDGCNGILWRDDLISLGAEKDYPYRCPVCESLADGADFQALAVLAIDVPR
jgi:hypothetical protein